ncbi:hypothetical protein ACRAWC_01715 [Leifsonia sp. L25]|uniref:hypothetical protein n=1 Tax=Leifsonia sp. L25 TaxID=3423957 RepID=UPI003D6802A5
MKSAKPPVVETGPYTGFTVAMTSVCAAVVTASVVALIFAVVSSSLSVVSGVLLISGLTVSAGLLAYTIGAAENEKAQALRDQAAGTSPKKTRASRREIATLRRLLADAEQRNETKSKGGKK